MEIEILKNQLDGLEAKGKTLRENEKLFLNSQGIETAIERAKADKEVLTESWQKTKEDLKKLEAQKKEGVDASTQKMVAKLNEFLPTGTAFFDMSEGFEFGWEYLNTRQKYNSLSGGQKHIFDAAIENLLGSNIMIIEAGEIDKDHLESLMEDLVDNPKQVFICTWYKDFTAPKGFEIVEV